jgi:flagellar basal body rod protein FlgG
MIYGLYLSATGLLTSSYRQDVIANNLANAETIGFKKDVPLFRQRLTAAQENLSSARNSNALLEKIGGGALAMPTAFNSSQGALDPSSNNLDMAIEGNGYFQVQNGSTTALTRDGRFSINAKGQLAMAGAEGQPVLGTDGQPIALGNSGAPVSINGQGEITQAGKLVGRIALMDVDSPGQLTKQGNNLLSVGDPSTLKPATGVIHSNFLEQANVDPASELAGLMDAQRQLEANANMIRYQDSTLDKLVNQVGKV